MKKLNNIFKKQQTIAKMRNPFSFTLPALFRIISIVLSLNYFLTANFLSANQKKSIFEHFIYPFSNNHSFVFSLIFSLFFFGAASIQLFFYLSNHVISKNSPNFKQELCFLIKILLIWLVATLVTFFLVKQTSSILLILLTEIYFLVFLMSVAMVILLIIVYFIYTVTCKS